jgi:hypothetical protein
MLRLFLVLLAACASHPVVIWASARTGGEERIQVRANGTVEYTAVNNGVEEKPEKISLAREQVRELNDMLRTQHACELTHDPAYIPDPEDGQTTLLVDYPDQKCKVTLSNGEWQRRGHDIVDTMRSMRLHPRS